MLCQKEFQRSVDGRLSIAVMLYVYWKAINIKSTIVKLLFSKPQSSKYSNAYTKYFADVVTSDTCNTRCKNKGKGLGGCLGRERKCKNVCYCYGVSRNSTTHEFIPLVRTNILAKNRLPRHLFKFSNKCENDFADENNQYCVCWNMLKTYFIVRDIFISYFF